MLTFSESETILRLRLIVCRAAQPDSLQWWDDRSLTTEGAFVVERLFGGRPRIAAAKIALATARTRHWAVIPRSIGVVHLFDFGDEIEDALRSIPLEEDWIPLAPLTSPKNFVALLKNTVADHITYKHAEPNQEGMAEIQPLQTITKADSILTFAKMLAWAYDLAKPNKPVFPFLKG